jgi:hypothetical protein
MNKTLEIFTYSSDTKVHKDIQRIVTSNFPIRTIAIVYNHQVTLLTGKFSTTTLKLSPSKI